MYIVFILQCQKVQNNYLIVWTEQKQVSFKSFSMVSSVTSTFILLLFLIVALHEWDPRKALLGPWLNNTEVYFTPSLILKMTQLQDKT